MALLKKFISDIRENYKTLILALFIAIGFWLVVSVQLFPTIVESVEGIKLGVLSTDYMTQHNLSIVGSYDDIVSVKIEGKRYDISALSAEDFTASVDLSSVRSAGTYTVPVDVTPSSGDCTVVETEPHSVTLVIDEIISRDFPVVGTAPDISLPEGYYADEVKALPDTITLTGSAGILDKVTSVEARSTFSGEIHESHQTTSEIIIYGENGARIVGDSLKLSADNISVNIPVYKQKELPLRFSLTNYPPNFDTDSLKYTITPPTITIAAPNDAIDFLSELDIGTIDISDIRLNQPVTIPISLPDGYKNLSGNTNARITWDIGDYGKMDYTISNIALQNVPDNYNVSLVTNEITVTVIGPAEQLAELSQSSIMVSANLLGVPLRGGSQDVELSVAIIGSKQKCWATGSYKANVYAEAVTEGQE